MKKTFAMAILMLGSVAVFGQWAVDKGHSRVGFTATHMMLFDVNGYFKAFEVNITATKDDLSDAIFDVSADIATVSTGNENRDADIVKPNFFDAAQFPKLTFKSKSLTKIDGTDKKTRYKLAGDLTIKGVTKPVELELTITGPIMNERSKKLMAGAKVTGTVKRTDFGVGGPGGSVNEDIIIDASGELRKN